MRLYVDSNVIISYIRREFGGLTRAQVIRTEDFLVKCGREKHTLILSDLIFDEVAQNSYTSAEETKDILRAFGIEFEVIETTDELLMGANEIRLKTGLHLSDSAHVRLALEAKADAIVTWNIKDFRKAEKLVKCVTPEELAPSS